MTNDGGRTTEDEGRRNALREFFEALALEWDAQQAPERAARLRALLAPFDALLRDARAILEVGTGTGTLVPLVRERAPFAHLVALDLAYTMLQRAQTRAPFASFVQADAHALPFDAARFDVVVCHASFPHFGDKCAALGEMRRALTCGGYLLILHDIGRAQVNAIHQNARATVIHHDLLPSGAGMGALLTRAGFVALQIEDGAERYCVLARAPV